MALVVAIEFDARAEAAAHSADVLIPLRKALVIASVILMGFGGGVLAYELYRLSLVGGPSSNQLSSVAVQLIASLALVAAGIYLLAQCPALRRPLPTAYQVDQDGFTARWDDGSSVRLAWGNPRLRLFLRDMRDLLDVKGCETLISRSGSFVPFAVPAKMYDQVLSEATSLGLVTNARFFRGRGGLIVHTATVRGRKRG